MTVALLLTVRARSESICSALFYSDEYSRYGSDSKEKNDWVQDQTGQVNARLKNSKNRSAVESALRRIYMKPDRIQTAKRGELTFEILSRGLDPQTPTIARVKAKSGPARTLLSSFDFKRNNSVAPFEISPSPSGKYVLVKLSTHGNLDIFTGALIETATGRRVAMIEDMGTGIPAWISDSTFYFRTKQPGSSTTQATIGNDGLSYAKEIQIRYQQSEDETLVFAVVKMKSGKNGTRIFSPQGVQRTVVGRAEDVFSSDGSNNSANGDTFVRTEGKNGFGQIFRVVKQEDMTKPETPMELVVPETNRFIESASVLNGRMIVNLVRGKSRTTEVRELITGVLFARIEAPDCCELNIKSFDLKNKDYIFTMQSPIRKKIEWKYNEEKQAWSVKDESGDWRPADPNKEMMSDRDGVEYVMDYHSYKSKDGVEIPVRMTRRKDTVLGGNAPVLLEGYGGFGVNSYFNPSYKAMLTEFLKHGGVQVAPALRGTKFFGQAWHDAGKKLNKQNVIDDFIGAAEWIIAQNISVPRRIAISGGSHGGLVVGAALVQRPDLFGLALPQFGPMDFARKPKLDLKTFQGQASEYGNMHGDPIALANAEALSPYFNLKPRNYPMTVGITGQKDSRVNPDHMYRFIAKLQDMQRGPAPILMYSLKNSGHWMRSMEHQDLIAFRANTIYWTTVFDYFGMQMSESN
jgi:prolyl oligopeptidase PreP (S9A serine peptidase family)